jgi:excisionase family DNA binding protein
MDRETCPTAGHSDLLDNVEAAKRLDVAPGTLEVWRSTGRYGIPYIKVGRRVKYRPADLDRWLESRTVNGNSK